MLKLIVGLVIIFIGGLLFIYGFYYGWAADTPGIEQWCMLKYKKLSWWFGISSYICFVIGSLFIFLSIKKK